MLDGGACGVCTFHAVTFEDEKRGLGPREQISRENGRTTILLRAEIIVINQLQFRLPWIGTAVWMLPIIILVHHRRTESWQPLPLMRKILLWPCGVSHV